MERRFQDESLVLTAALSAGRDLGYRAGILQATEKGYPVYARLGCQDRCRMEQISWEYP